MIVGSILSSFNNALRMKSILNASLLRLGNMFCEIKQEQNLDELKNYQTYLNKFNQSIKKPHEKMLTQQQRIIQVYLNQKKYSQIISFMLNNTGNTLCSTTTASKIDADLASQWQNLTKKDQNAAAHALVYFRQTKVFNIFKIQIEKNIKLKGIQGIEVEQLITYLCGQLINRKSLRFISKLYPKAIQRFQIYGKIYKYIDKNNYKGPYFRQKRNLLSYIGLMLDPTLNKKQDNIAQRQRSPLQISIESFMKVLQIQYERQVKINNFYVDYLVKINRDNQIKQFIIEVNGNYHYNINGQLKGRQILRNLIINEYAPLRIIHYQDFLVSKGHRNKLAYIDSLLSEKVINWECTHGGKNSRWQVKMDQQLMKSN